MEGGILKRLVLRGFPGTSLFLEYSKAKTTESIE